MRLHVRDQIAALGPVDRPLEPYAHRRGIRVLGEAEQRREVQLPRRHVGGAADFADAPLGDDLEAVDACLAVLYPHGAIEGADCRSPVG